MKQNNFTEIALIFLFVILIHSYVPTILEILSNGANADFNWTPAKCVFKGINHYSSYLMGDGKCYKDMSQYGEYAPGFYILIYPYTLFDWTTAKILWAITNIILIFLTTYLLCKKFEVNKIFTLLILFFIFYSIITRVNLIMGQQTILMLFFLTLPFIYKSKWMIVFSGISYFKYNIGYVLFLFYLVSKKYGKLLLSTIPYILGLLIYCLITSTNPIDNLFQPLQLLLKNSAVTGSFNNIFLFSFLKFFIHDTLSSYLVILMITCFFNILVIAKITKVDDDLLKLSCLCLLILVSLPHWGHDYILLIPLLVYSIKNYESNLFLFRVNFFVVIYFLQLYAAIQRYLNIILLKLNFEYIDFFNISFPYFNIFILFSLLIINLNFSKKNLSKKLQQTF